MDINIRVIDEADTFEVEWLAIRLFWKLKFVI